MAYKPYRGKKKNTRGRRVLLAAALLILLLAAVALFFLAQEYIIFTAEGFRFDFPFMRQADQPTQPTAPPDDDSPTVVIDTTVPPTTAPPTTQPPQTRPGVTKALLAQRDDYPAQLPDGVTHTALSIKDIDGLWHIPLADALPDIPATDAQQALASQLRGSGDIAVISVYKDHENPRLWRKWAVTVEGGQTWLDHYYNRWFSPYLHSDDPSAPDGTMLAGYLLAQCRALGLGEAVLVDFQFPVNGRLNLISYGQNTDSSKTEALTYSASLLRQAHGDSAVLLSCLLTETAATQYIDEAAGQDAAALAQYFDILYVPTSDPDYDTTPLFEYIQSRGQSCRIGLWLKASAPTEREIDFILAP